MSPKQAPSILASFRHRVFRSIWIANFFANLGMFIQVVASSWVMMTLTGSSTMVSLIQASKTLPIVLLSLLAGVAADTFGRRSIMLYAQVFMLVIALLLLALAVTGAMTPWLLLTCTFLTGCGMAFKNPAWQASVSEMLPPRNLTAGIALNSISINVGRTAGPALGGFIVALAGATMAFLLYVISHLSLILVLFRLRGTGAQAAAKRKHGTAGTWSGIATVLSIPMLRAALVRGFVFCLCGIPVTSLMPIVTRDIVSGGADIYGLLLGAFGVGGILCAVVMPKIRYFFPTSAITTTTTICIGLATVVIGTSSNLYISGLAHAVAGACWLLCIASFNVTIQTLAPGEFHGRALSLYYLSIFGGMTAGSFLWGVAADAHGISAALAACGAVQASAALLAFLMPLPGSREKDLDYPQRTGP